MLQFLQSSTYAPMALAALLALALIGLRAASSDRRFRHDLGGGILLLLSFLVLRLLGRLVEGHWSPTAQLYLRVAWMLAFAFGAIRSAVSVLLWAARFRSPHPPPKILRDVLDFSLYSLTALPILKTQLQIDLTALVTTSAIVSVVLGLALQDTLGNLFAGLSIQVERPFQVGDWVTIGAHTGRVVQIAWRATRIETGRQEVITLPNNLVSKEPVKNYSRAAQPVGSDVFLNLSLDTPPNLVKATVLDVLGEIPFVLLDPAPVCRPVAFEESAIRYLVRYFVSDFANDGLVVDELHSRLWYRFRRDNIKLARPVRLVHEVDLSPRDELGPEEMAELLGAVDLLSTLSPGELARLARQMVPRRYGKGEVVIEAGSEGTAFYIVASGEVTVRTPTRTDVELMRLGRGQYFGEIALLTGEPRVATVVAAQDTVLLELDRELFARLFAANPNLARQLSALLAQRRAQLKAAAAGNAESAHQREENRIFSRLRQIFGLAE